MDGCPGGIQQIHALKKLYRRFLWDDLYCFWCGKFKVFLLYITFIEGMSAPQLENMVLVFMLPTLYQLLIVGEILVVGLHLL